MFCACHGRLVGLTRRFLPFHGPMAYSHGRATKIDAALDTHKVRAAASLLAERARSGNEQCVVISHRPEMMEKAR